MAFWVLDLVWRTLGEEYDERLTLCASWMRRGCHCSRETLVHTINHDHYMSLEMVGLAAVRIRFKAYGQKLFSCLALRASRIR